MAKYTISKIISEVSGKYGAPMGRPNIGTRPVGSITSGRNNRITKSNQIKIFDRPVPMVDGAYDKGGAYWGIGTKPLRVAFTKDMAYIEFYRGYSYDSKEE